MGAASEIDTIVSPLSPVSHSFGSVDQMGDCSELYATQVFEYDDIDDTKSASGTPPRREYATPARSATTIDSSILNRPLPQTPPTLSPLTQSSTIELSKPSWNRFTIPTKNESLSSGFPFDQRLYDLKVTHDEWFLFSSEIVSAAKLTISEDYLAWTAGVAAGTISSSVLLVFGPVVGYYSGKNMHKKKVVQTVKEKLLHEGDLRLILRRWNDNTFAKKGFQAWLELPMDGGEINKEHHFQEALRDKSGKEQKKAKKEARRFRIIIIPNDDSSPVLAESSTTSSNVLVEAPGNEHMEPQELHGDSLEPPPYSSKVEGEE